MFQNVVFPAFRPWFTLLLIILIIWEGVWKGIALWKAARNDHSTWFICLFVFNTIGILPLIYILRFSKNKQKTGSE